MNKRILKLAIPNIISNISIPLLGMVDTALMGHMDSLVYVGAIALGSMVFNFIYWGLGFLRMGTVGFTAQAKGANDKKEITRILYRAGIIAFIGGIFIIAIHPLIINFGLGITSAGPEVKLYAQEYFNIRIWAAPASLLILVLSGWFVGMHNTIYPMIISILTNILNIGFSLWFVYGMDMKSDGVAWGTLISQYLSATLGIGFIVYKYREYIIKVMWSKLLDSKALKKFANVNSDIFIRTLGIIFVFSFFTVQSANINDKILAVNAILFQFFILFSYMLDGFANAAEALSGEAVGMNSRKTMLKYTKYLFGWGLIFSLLFTLAYVFFGNEILGLLTNNKDIIETAQPMMFWVIMMPLVSFAAFMWDGIFIGATASKAMRNTMILATLIVFLPLYYWGPWDLINRLWIAFMAYMFARGLFLGLMFNSSVLKKLNG
ncbi:MAG: MATE family efflux transporter [Bacteroidales bacterium]|nr:MATE family efflux transporter [Bacteroidales bacterium]